TSTIKHWERRPDFTSSTKTPTANSTASARLPDTCPRAACTWRFPLPSSSACAVMDCRCFGEQGTGCPSHSPVLAGFLWRPTSAGACGFSRVRSASSCAWRILKDRTPFTASPARAGKLSDLVLAHRCGDFLLGNHVELRRVLLA